uniref:tetratricopeptide repeat protein n=1 Tax=Oscillatoria salina TaxID=331517 RepID=UPI001CCE99F4
MLRRIWQWLKNFFNNLTGGTEAMPASSSTARENNGSKSSSPLSDTDYEFLYTQLLEGVTHGWEEKRIVKFFQDLEDRSSQQEWLTWLKRFGERVSINSTPNRELATRMVRLGERVRTIPSLRAIGQESYKIGIQLLNRGQKAEIWEYQGPDAEGGTQPTGSPLGREAIALDELLQRLEQDPNLLASVAQELGLETNDPRTVVTELTKRYNPEDGSTPNDAEGWFKRGALQFQAGNIEAALNSLDRALEMKPDFAEAWFGKGNMLLSLQRNEEALAALDKAIEINPDFYQAWDVRGNILFNSEQAEAAIASLEKANEIKPDFYQAWYNKAIVLSDIEQFDAAIAAFNRVIELKPDLAEAWYNRGMTLAEMGRFSDAIANYDRALLLKPQAPEIFSKRQEALENLAQRQTDSTTPQQDSTTSVVADPWQETSSSQTISPIDSNTQTVEEETTTETELETLSPLDSNTQTVEEETTTETELETLSPIDSNTQTVEEETTTETELETLSPIDSDTQTVEEETTTETELETLSPIDSD